MSDAFHQERLAKPHLELIFVGDFDRWDMLLMSDTIASHSYQGDRQSLINLMVDLVLQLLFSQGIISYTRTSKLVYAACAINLISNSTCLAENRIVCVNLDTNHGLDHTAIQIVFALHTSEFLFISPRQLFKSAPWNKIC